MKVGHEDAVSALVTQTPESPQPLLCVKTQREDHGTTNQDAVLTRCRVGWCLHFRLPASELWESMSADEKPSGLVCSVVVALMDSDVWYKCPFLSQGKQRAGSPPSVAGRVLACQEGGVACSKRSSQQKVTSEVSQAWGSVQWEGM